MLSSTKFQTNDCPKIDALDVNAYFELSLDEVNVAMLRLDTSWGCTSVDLTPAVKASETITHLFLTPTAKPTSLQFNREDYGREGAENGGVDCIHGDDLSRIISMQLLKDVDQSKPMQDGNVYIYNHITEMFEPWDLMSWVKEVNNTLEQHGSRITIVEGDITAIKNDVQLLKQRVTKLEQRMTVAEQNIENLLQRMTRAETNITNLQNRVGDIEGAIFNWPADKTTKIPRGNINIYGDPSNTNNHSRYIATHSTSSNVTGDIYAA